MNRHVSKRVCLGLQFETPEFLDTDISEMVPLPPQPAESMSPIPDMSMFSDSPEEVEKPQEDFVKSNKVPCPYCKKLMKGERGVRKHLDFYGCPKAFSSNVSNE